MRTASASIPAPARCKKEGEYLTIGEDMVAQVFPESKSKVRLAIKAPKDVTILRGDLRERSGARRPDGLAGPMAGPRSWQKQKQ